MAFRELLLCVARASGCAQGSCQLPRDSLSNNETRQEEGRTLRAAGQTRTPAERGSTRCHHHPPRPPGSLSFCFPLSEGSPPRRLAGGFRSCYITFALKAWRWEAAHRQRDDTVEFTEPMTTRLTRFPKMGGGSCPSHARSLAPTRKWTKGETVKLSSSLASVGRLI